MLSSVQSNTFPCPRPPPPSRRDLSKPVGALNQTRLAAYKVGRFVIIESYH